MKLFTAKIEGKDQPGLCIGKRAALLTDIYADAPATLLEFIEQMQDRRPEELTEADLPRKMDELILTSPIPYPKHDVLCMGKNYVDHIAELGGNGEKPVPHYFTKRVNRMTGPGETVRGHFDVDPCMDYEVELAVIIGKTGTRLSLESVWDHILGFSILNDYSSRTLQMAHVQWFRGKSLDGYTALGPWIVTKDEFTQPLHLNLTSAVNGEIRQNANTRQMIFSVREMLSELSQGMTLEAGDIFATGTPSGVGMGFVPPRFLKAGDRVTLTIEGIGVLENLIE